MNKDKVIDFDADFIKTDESINELKTRIEDFSNVQKVNNQLIEEIYKSMGVVKNPPEVRYNTYLYKVNSEIDDIIIPKYKGSVDLSLVDTVVGIIAGIIASIIDIVFIGSPDVVKVWEDGKNKGERFDGSVFTSLLRKIGNGDDKLSKALHWLSDKCKVPYDISVQKDTVTPNNHRLRGFAHDPGLGLLFSITDIILGTTTTIDNEGHLKIIFNDATYPDSQKLMAVFYYFGHLLSDVCTARGLPIPGFVLTQFFATGEDDSIAKICEDMYINGYDLRHLISMSSAVAIKDLIINIYCEHFKQHDAYLIQPLASKEITNNRNEIFKYKLRMVSDTIACGGNVLKFYVPPTSGSWTALNIPEWEELICDTIINLKYELRDQTTEKIIFNRTVIDDNWNTLLIETK